MNASRLAAARAKIHEAIDELFDAVEADEQDAEVSAERSSRPRPRTVRKPRAIVRPTGEAKPDVAARAKSILRDRGFR